RSRRPDLERGPARRAVPPDRQAVRAVGDRHGVREGRRRPRDGPRGAVLGTAWHRDGAAHARGAFRLGAQGGGGAHGGARAGRRVGMGLAPLLNAMFANSSLSDGGLNGYMSFRGHIWTQTDPARCGLLRLAFRERATFADYVDWALDVPLYFILRGGTYRTTVTGTPFRRFLADGAAGERATLDDWNLHLTTLFPEVRLKGYIELRSADSQ